MSLEVPTPPTITPTPTATSTPSSLPVAVRLVTALPLVISAGTVVTIQVEFIDSDGVRAHYTEPLLATLHVFDATNSLVSSSSASAARGLANIRISAPERAGEYRFTVASAAIPTQISESLTTVPGPLASLVLAEEVPRELNIHQSFALRVRAVDRFLNSIPEPVLSVRVVNGDATLANANSTFLSAGVSEFSRLRYTSGSAAQLEVSSRDGSVRLMIAPQEVISSHRFALAWDPPPIEGLSNIWVWYRLREWTTTSNPLSCGTAEFAAAIRSRAEEAKRHTDTMPAGTKTINMFWEMTPLWDDPRDAVINSAGEIQGWRDDAGVLHPYISPWWDEATRESRCRVEAFIQEFHRLEGEVDYIVLDTERGITNWHIDLLAKRYYGADRERFPAEVAEANRLAYYQAIENDPRMDRPELPEFGFSDTRPLRQRLTEGSLSAHVARWLESTVRRGPRRNAYLQWNHLVEQRVALYKKYAVDAPIRALYPNVKLSEYGSYYTLPEHNLPDANGHQISIFAGPGDIIVGNRQSRPMYGDLPDGAYYFVRQPSLYYQGSPFNALLHELNHIRSAILARPDVPFQPWIAHRSFGSQPSLDECTACRLDDNDYYFELVYHLLLASTDPLLWWNPDYLATQGDAEVLSAAMDEYDARAGYSVNRSPRIEPLISWEADYILTAQETDYATVFRFTPRISDGDNIESLILSASPARLRTPSGAELEFPDGDVVHDPLSSKGVWVVVPR